MAYLVAGREAPTNGGGRDLSDVPGHIHGRSSTADAGDQTPCNCRPETLVMGSLDHRVMRACSLCIAGQALVQ